jgi:YD repeat-containing protein
MAIPFPMCSVLVAMLSLSSANGQAAFQYFYDDSGQLIRVIDSAGNEIDYTYDAVGNIVQVTRTTAPGAGALAVLDFTPQSGSVGTVVTIQGQNFSATPASNTVTFNGVAATVLSATATTLTASVPASATTGPIAVTVAGKTATSSSNFTIIPLPTVLSISPQYLVSSSSAITVPNFQVTGINLTGATFSFTPAFLPPLVAVNSVTINSSGTSAILSLAIAPGALGGFTLVGTNSAGTPNPVAGPGNTLQIITPDSDADGDGLTNAVEVAIGTNPLNAYTSGDGLPDGWQVFYGLNPLDPTVAKQDFDASGLTVLQDFQMGLSPVNPNRVPPTVSQTNLKNGATGVYLNSIINVRFSEPLQIGTSLNAAQSAITTALGANTTVSASSQQIAAATLQTYMNRTCCGNSVIAGTITLIGPSGSVPGGITPSSDGLSATFQPTQPLQSNTQYTINVVGVKDAAGNLMTKPFTSTFTTGTSLQQFPPQIVQTSPTNGAISVPANTNIVVTFSIPINPSSIAAAGAFTVFDTTAGTPVSGTVGLDLSDTVATFTPSQALAINHWFAVSLTTAITDLEVGNPLPGNAGFGFTTGALTEESDSVTFSVLNAAGTTTPPPGIISGEADSLTFAVLNGINTTTLPTSIPGEADSLTFSVLNGINTTTLPTSIPGEADSLTFSVLNGTSTTSLPTVIAGEADSLTFSVLNGINTSTLPAVIAGEADSLTFSVLNGINTTTLPAVIAGEADSLTFAVMNGITAPPITSVSYEADSLTFSVCNGTTVCSSSEAEPARPGSGSRRPTKVAAPSHSAEPPVAGMSAQPSSNVSSRPQPSNPASGQDIARERLAAEPQSEAASNSSRPSPFLMALHRLLHRHSRQKINASSRTQTAAALPEAKARSSLSDQSTSAASGGAAAGGHL